MEFQQLELIRFLLTVTFVALSTADRKEVRVARSIEIVEIDPAHPSTLGVVGGMQQCGGPGLAVELRYEPCNKGETPCRVPKDGIRRPAELEFIPSQDISSLGVRFNFIMEDGEELTFERVIPNSTVRAGHSYNCVIAGEPTRELVEHSVTVQWMIYQEEDNDVEVCAEVHYILYEPEHEMQ